MQEISPIKQRMLEVLDYKDLSRCQFYKGSGMTRGVLDKSSGISEDNIAKFVAYFPEVSPEWLITGKGEMIKKEVLENTEASNLVNQKGIPLIPVEAMAGLGHGSVAIKEKDIQERYVVPDFVESDFMIRIKGPSMQPNFNSGDIIACKIIRDRSFFQWGKVYVIHHREQGTMVKRLFPAGNQLIECRSDNPRYPSFELEASALTDIAIVLGVIRLE